MSHRRNTVHPQQQQHQPPRSSGVQRSYVVSIDAGAFANVEIVVGGCHREGVWTPSRTATITAKSKSHDHASYSPIPPTSPTKRTPHSPLRSRPTGPVPVTISVTTARSAPDAWSKRTTATHEREHAAAAKAHHRMAEERAREQLRYRREAARVAEARRAAAEEEARRRHAEQQRREQRRALREERRRQEECTRRAREITNAWRTYEARWGLLSQRQPELGLLSALTFERIPWPVVDVPLDRTTTATTLDGMLRPEAICEFLLSSAHSPDVSPKDRIRAALRRWHPDKFSRVLSQVMESERGLVEEGMGIVVRCLNDMLERENHA